MAMRPISAGERDRQPGGRRAGQRRQRPRRHGQWPQGRAVAAVEQPADDRRQMIEMGAERRLQRVEPWRRADQEGEVGGRLRRLDPERDDGEPGLGRALGLAP